MNIRSVSTPNKWPGGNRCEVLVIHWWGDPTTHPTLDGVVAHLTNPASQVSAHYVVSGDQVVKLCNETDRAWHARQANDFAIGIEVDPNTPGNTYQTVAELVRDIRSRRGGLPLKRHSDYVNTQCPGTIDLGRIEELARGDEMYQGKTAEQWAKDAEYATGVADKRKQMLADLQRDKDTDDAIAEDRRKIIAKLAEILGVPEPKTEADLDALYAAAKASGGEAVAKLAKIEEIVNG